MNKAPAFQFYAKDFYTGTADLSSEEVGLYIRALAWSWENGPLPVSDERRARLLLVSPEELRRSWGIVSGFWTEGVDGFTNDLLEHERQKQADYRQKQAENGSRGGRPKNPTHNPNKTQAFSVDNPTANPNESSAFAFASSDQKLSPPVPREIELILAKEPFDRTNAENDALAAHRGVTLRPLGMRPERVRDSIAANEVLHRGHYGGGSLASCVRGLCIPSFLSAEWIAQSADGVAPSALETWLRNWINATVEALPPGPVGDAVKFWRAAWDRDHGAKQRPKGLPRPMGVCSNALDADVEALLDKLNLNAHARHSWFTGATLSGTRLLVTSDTARDWILRHYHDDLCKAAGCALSVEVAA